MSGILSPSLGMQAVAGWKEASGEVSWEGVFHVLVHEMGSHWVLDCTNDELCVGMWFPRLTSPVFERGDFPGPR